ncbi:MAG: hypothetical protein LAN36_11440 [Acidobacteriia bacterium]|nr:hypothetical protein [Terriglobia bacterium]
MENSQARPGLLANLGWLIGYGIRTVGARKVGSEFTIGELLWFVPALAFIAAIWLYNLAVLASLSGRGLLLLILVVLVYIAVKK